MKNYLRHNFRRHYRSGRSRISVVNDQPQDIKRSSDFVSPLKGIISGYIPDKYQRLSSAVIKQEEVEQKKNSSWLNNLIWNNKSAVILKGDLLKREYTPLKDSCHAFKFGLKKYFSACNFFDKKYNSFKKESYKLVDNILPPDTVNCECPLKQTLSTNFNSLVPNITKCMHHAPYLECNRSRSHSNPYLKKFLRPSYEILDTSSRSFTTLRAKSESPKPIIPDPSNVTRSLNRSVDNSGLLTVSGQGGPKAIERDPANVYEKFKKRDFDWLNSFSSEAVILQPSREEFSIKKLINKTTFQERLWGLPSRQSFAKPLGPRMNDNLVQYTALKHKMQSNLKKNNFIGEGTGQNEVVKKLIKTAKEKNLQNGLKKTKKLSSKLSAKNMLRTIKDSINLTPVDTLKTKEKNAENKEEKRFRKVPKKRSILNFRLPNLKLKEKQINLLQNDKPINKPSATEYESSASYRHVFQELFNKASKKKKTTKSAIALSFFNRQQDNRNFSRSISKLATDNSIRKEKELKKKDRSGAVLERNRTVNLKYQARTPFQKPSNTQLTSKSKASFSTVSKIPKMNSLSRRKLLKKTKDKTSSPKVTSSKRSISTDQKGKKENKPVIKKTLYSTLGYYPAIPKRIDMKPKIKLKNTKNNSVCAQKKGTKQKNKSHATSGNSNSGYLSQRRSLSSLGVLAEDVTDIGTSVKIVTEPDEQVFKEVMILCKGQSEAEKNPSAKNQKVKRYNRCSVQEKKRPERRRGFVCRIANMLNIGCGRRRRPKTGCQECGKKTDKQNVCRLSSK